MATAGWEARSETRLCVGPQWDTSPPRSHGANQVQDCSARRFPQVLHPLHACLTCEPGKKHLITPCLNSFLYKKGKKKKMSNYYYYSPLKEKGIKMR